MIEGNISDFRFSVTLRIFSNNLDLAAISEALCTEPSVSYLKGDLDNRNRPRGRSTWQYTAPVDESESLDRHVLALWMALGTSKASIDQLKQKFDVDIICNFRSNLDWSEFDVSPQAMNALSSFGLPVKWSMLLLLD